MDIQERLKLLYKMQAMYMARNYSCRPTTIYQKQAKRTWRRGNVSYLFDSFESKNSPVITVIRSAIIHGNIDQAITLIDKYFPGVLQEEARGEELQLSLKCGKFVEMMREYCECSKSRRLRTNSVDSRMSAETSSQSLNANEDRTIRSNSVSGPSAAHNPTPTPGRRLSYAAIAASLSPSSSTETPRQQQDSMDVDDDMGPNYKMDLGVAPNDSANTWSGRTCPTNNGLNEEHLSAPTQEENSSTSSMEVADSLKLVMQYGQKLQNEYQNDTQKTRSKLVVSQILLV